MLSNAFLSSTVAFLVPQICASLLKNIGIDQIGPLMTSDDLTFDLTLKNERSSFVMIFDAISNVADRVSLRGPVVELERGSQEPPSSVGGK